MLHDSPPGAILPPWAAEPFRLLSLLEIMEHFKPDVLLDVFGSGLGALRHIPREYKPKGCLGIAFPLAPLLAEGREGDLREVLTRTENFCASYGLAASKTTTRRAIDQLAERKMDSEQLRALSEELHGRLRDELRAAYFLHLTPREADLFSQPRDLWEAVVDRYPSAIRDIEEASKCLAVNRNTACVFHLMRLLERGLRTLGGALNDPGLDPKRNPSWDAILRKCDDELRKPVKDRCAEWRTDDAFFSTATANLRAVKDAWRNPTMHVEKHYDSEEAREIYSAARAFMRHLAGKLSE